MLLHSVSQAKRSDDAPVQTLREEAAKVEPGRAGGVEVDDVQNLSGRAGKGNRGRLAARTLVKARNDDEALQAGGHGKVVLAVERLSQVAHLHGQSCKE